MSAESTGAQSVGCDTCGSRDYSPLGRRVFPGVETRQGTIAFEVTLVCCSRCGLVFQSPVQNPATLSEYYEHMYREEGCRSRTAVHEELEPRLNFLSRIARALGPDAKRMLEIGCADGSWLAACRAMGFEVEGIEPSAVNAELCRGKGIRVTQSMYEAYDFGGAGLDVITSFYVMEHLVSPAHFLASCNRGLREGGLLVIEIPDIAAYEAEPAASDLLFFFEHQVHFTRESVQTLLERAGFELLEFAERATHEFGMQLAARRVREARGPEAAAPRDGAAGRSLALVEQSRASFERRFSELAGSVQAALADVASRGQTAALFGAGSYARQVLEVSRGDRRSLRFAVDNNSAKWGQPFADLVVQPPSALSNGIDVVLVASTFHPEICGQLRGMGFTEDRIIVL